MRIKSNLLRLELALSCFLYLTLISNCAGASDMAVDFSRDIKPILSNACYRCHGPDAAERKGGTKEHALRLDTAEGAYAKYSGSFAIVPGLPEKSEFIARIESTDDELVMPPPPKGGGVSARLSARDIELLKRWIQQGAKYARHWAYVKPVRGELPEVSDKNWARNPVDTYVLARLEKEGLKPQPEADKYTLIRRASLDITGLPPTLEEVNAFVADASPDSYEKLVDRLLAKPSYGEHWARMWLDLARYADSGGYASDTPRTIWAYRDYVIKSFNSNKPFDQFTIEQIAGDMLPNPTEEQIVATAFHRNTMTNTEGGTTREEFRSAAVVDRVTTTMAVWMGSSYSCSQCHDHKYDPLPQKEFFQIYAIFNNTEDADRQDEEPTHKFETPEVAAKRAKLSDEIAAVEKKIKELTPVPPKDSPKDTAVKKPDEAAAKPNPTPSPSAELKATNEKLAALKKQLGAIKPLSVPVMRELTGNKRRKTNIQLRGNYLSLGDEVSEGVPAAFHPAPPGVPINRLSFAKWLVAEENPMVGRVIANRYWEQIFGIGIVRTSEEFGSQGELPSHPELLDWLAIELVQTKWDMKKFVKTLMMTAAYRQSSKVTPELYERDPDNRLLARGPRFRMSAESVRDQALAISGLLSPKMYGPSVKPPRPSAGLTAAFGGGLDWETSVGEDKFRRALYTEARRTSPYPSTATFDAPSREVCTLRRVRTNTPLQALVTLNDPVYVEAAQALARRMANSGATPQEKVVFGFRASLIRPPNEAEVARLVKLYNESRERFAADPKKAAEFATKPIGELPAKADAVDLAAWTAVANVLLNLDETLMKR